MAENKARLLREGISLALKMKHKKPLNIYEARALSRAGYIKKTKTGIGLTAKGKNLVKKLK